ncbi:mitochondrial ribosomal subunit S27-domain-containing protein, partial [Crassisporium funariophilum]
PARLAALTRLRCSLLQTSHNPSSLRTGAKYLKARLRGPSMLAYYPPEFAINRIVNAKEYAALEMVDEDEDERVQDVIERKKRGKGAPKKAKTKADSRRLHKKR